MGLLETLTLKLGPALAKAVLKLWLPENPVAEAVGGSVIDVLKSRGEDFATQDAADRLFRNLASEVGRRLDGLIEVEFPRMPEHDRIAAVLSVTDVLATLDLSAVLVRADLNAVALELSVRPLADAKFATLGGDATRLANLVLRESCAYAVRVASKLPDFHAALGRELLSRTSELSADLARVLDVVDDMRRQLAGDEIEGGFEVQYRRALLHRLDRMQLFGIRLVGAGAHQPELSVAYVSLASRDAAGGQPRNVEAALAGRTRIVVRGEAGSGKTTLLQWLAVQAASRCFAGELEPWNARIPVYVSLRDHADADFPPPERMIVGLVPNLAALLPAKWAHRTLAAGALVHVDGLDEVPVARRSQLLGWLRDLVSDFPESVFVLTSRPAALDARLADGVAANHLGGMGFEQVTLEPMGLADSEALISQWHQAVGREMLDRETLARLELFEKGLIRALRDRPAVRNLASNPLLCSMMCVLNWDRKQRLPDNRMELYRLALDMLIDARDADRNISAARLSALDKPAKETLLDGVAYWMMRNDATEAEQGEVVAQVGRLLERLSHAPQQAEGVLQELLERSGVLRQPQAGIVDFVHRTFLEYMAARAAVSAGDLGLLAERARDDGWRETIVFAAGHARGQQRDQLIAKLLKRPLFRARRMEQDVTAACCLETAAADLSPPLLLELRACAKDLFPPRRPEQARLLAPAAALEPDLLRGHNGFGAETVAACIRCAAMVGGEAMLGVIESYADEPGLEVFAELVDAWPVFDAQEYLDRVILKRTEEFGGIDLRQADQDTLGCLKLLVLKRAHSDSPANLAKAIDTFVEKRTIAFSSKPFADDDELSEPPTDAPATYWTSIPAGAGRQSRHVVNQLDAERLAAITSLRGLDLGLVRPGVLKTIASLPNLEALACRVPDPAELEALARCPALRQFDLTDYGVRRKRTDLTFDLRGLASWPALEDLTVSHLDLPLILPASRRLTRLKLIFVDPQAVEPATRMTGLKSLYLHLKELPPAVHDLRALTRLETVHVTLSKGDASLKLPSTVNYLWLDSGGSISVTNAHQLMSLTDLVLSKVKDAALVEPLVELQSLTWLSSFGFTDSRFDDLLRRARERGVTVFDNR